MMDVQNLVMNFSKSYDVYSIILRCMFLNLVMNIQYHVKKSNTCLLILKALFSFRMLSRSCSKCVVRITIKMFKYRKDWFLTKYIYVSLKGSLIINNGIWFLLNSLRIFYPLAKARCAWKRVYIYMWTLNRANLEIHDFIERVVKYIEALLSDGLPRLLLCSFLCDGGPFGPDRAKNRESEL